MTNMGLRFTIALSLLGFATAAMAQPAPRQPTGKWNVSFDAAQCVASRSYGSPEERIFLALKAPPLGDVMQISVTRKAGYATPDQVDATIRVDDRPPLKTNMIMFAPKGSTLRVYQSNLASADFATVRGAKALTIKSAGLHETFTLSQVEPVLKVMDECVVDLRRVWNVREPSGEQSPLAKRATGNLIRYFKAEDYPDTALINRDGGSARFSLLIDEVGKVTDCTIIETSGIAVLDAQTCVIARQRAKFDPARGQDGKPAKDAHIARIKWRIP